MPYGDERPSFRNKLLKQVDRGEDASIRDNDQPGGPIPDTTPKLQPRQVLVRCH